MEANTLTPIQSAGEPHLSSLEGSTRMSSLCPVSPAALPVPCDSRDRAASQSPALVAEALPPAPAASRPRALTHAGVADASKSVEVVRTRSTSHDQVTEASRPALSGANSHSGSFADSVAVAAAVVPREPPEDPQARALRQKCQQNLQRAREAHAGKGWIHVPKPPKQLQQCQLDYQEKGSLVLVRVQCVLPVSPQRVVETLRAGQGIPKDTKKRLLCDLTSDLCQAWLSVKLPCPFKDRDFVYGQWINAGPSETTIVQTSLENEQAASLCPPTKKFQRGRIVLQAMIMEPTSSGSSMTWLSCVDPKGKVPNAKKMTAKASAESVVALQQAAVGAR
eukprot:TRINITY_DN10933_c0_g1_i1.p1 TRINITY_DN10933_c0_g1~~TRINITY_DN10933_c0_g1_i1.p1  ORF type:complete len:336 (+),score=59.84 TRINITY_DN10933_c0_g1_i1:423-1430(+)